MGRDNIEVVANFSETTYTGNGFDVPPHCAVALTRDTGALRVIPGSHRIGDRYAGTLQEQISRSLPHWGVTGRDIPAIALETTPGDLVVFQIPYVQHAFDYYFRRPYQALGGPYTNYPGNVNGYQSSDETVLAQIRPMFANQHTVWLVSSEAAMWDARNLLQRWLELHGRATFHDEYAQVQVTRYELKQ